MYICARNYALTITSASFPCISTWDPMFRANQKTNLDPEIPVFNRCSHVLLFICYGVLRFKTL